LSKGDQGGKKQKGRGGKCEENLRRPQEKKRTDTKSGPRGCGKGRRRAPGKNFSRIWGPPQQKRADRGKCGARKGRGKDAKKKKARKTRVGGVSLNQWVRHRGAGEKRELKTERWDL